MKKGEEIEKKGVHCEYGSWFPDVSFPSFMCMNEEVCDGIVWTFINSLNIVK